MRQFTFFAVVTDQHIVEPNATLYGLDTRRAAEALVKRLKEEDVPLHGLICLGDLADTVQDPNRMTATASRLAYQHAHVLLSNFSKHILTIPGNHDNPSLMGEYFPSSWSEQIDDVYYVKQSGFDLIGLDLRTGPEPTATASPALLARLDEVLRRSSRVIILSHYPLFELDNQRIDDELSTTNRQDVFAILKKHGGKILACFHGHLHLWITSCTSGVTAYGVPSSAFNFVLEPQGTIKEKVGPAPCGYYLLGLADDGTIILRPRFLPAALHPEQAY